MLENLRSSQFPDHVQKHGARSGVLTLYAQTCCSGSPTLLEAFVGFSTFFPPSVHRSFANLSLPYSQEVFFQNGSQPPGWDTSFAYAGNFAPWSGQRAIHLLARVFAARRHRGSTDLEAVETAAVPLRPSRAVPGVTFQTDADRGRSGARFTSLLLVFAMGSSPPMWNGTSWTARSRPACSGCWRWCVRRPCPIRFSRCKS
jgi:hypothetical protein